jgi:hypothetical protein
MKQIAKILVPTKGYFVIYKHNEDFILVNKWREFGSYGYCGYRDRQKTISKDMPYYECLRYVADQIKY